jgi:hypothetical protein
MEWVNVLIGIALLLFGRKLFWLFVGCVGFIVAAEFAEGALQGQSEWLILLIALGVGLLGATVSIFLQRVLISIAGFFAGGYCLSTLATATLHTKYAGIPWLAYVVGGLLGAILTVVLLDPALIVVSSLAGATAVSQNVPLDSPAKSLLFVALLIFGIIVQTGQYARDTKSKQPQTEQNDSTG